MNYSLRMKRLLVGSAAGAMVLATVPTGIAAASVEDVCAGAEDAEFDDVADTNSHKENIDCLAAYAITVGTDDGGYEPGEAVTRGQMATFIARFISQAQDGDLEFPTDSPDAFNDDDGTTHEDAINYLASIDVVAGTTATTYEPGAQVTRGQMASFIVRALEFIGVTLPTADDAFDDDDGTTHEENINILEELQIVSGFNDGTYRPGLPVTRQQMATYIIGGAGAAEEQGEWNGEMVAAPTESNETITVTPDSDVTLVLPATEDTSDDRVYTVENAVAGTTYQIVLAEADNVSTDANGYVTFAEDGTLNEADFGTVAADITVVNGVPNSPADETASITPSGTSFTFRVDGDADETIVPVVYVDADEDGDLDIDADDEAPTEDFGTGGAINYNPGEAASGVIAPNQAVTEVDKTNDQIVAGGAAYNYDSNDTYYIDSSATVGGTLGTPDAAEQVTMAEFEAQLSVGDQLDGETYQRNPDFSSQFLLEDLTPGAPTLAATAASATEIEVDVTGYTTGATITLYLAEEDAGLATPDYPDADFDEVAEITAADDEDANETGIQYTITVNGADTARDFSVAATQTVDSEESAADEVDDVTVSAVSETVRPTITDTAITAEAGTAGLLDSGDTITFTFSENMDTTTASGFFRVSDSDTTVQIACAGAGANATCTRVDGPDADGVIGDRMTVAITGAPVVVGGEDNGVDTAGDTARVVLVSSDWDDMAGNQLDLANSGDVVVDDES